MCVRVNFENEFKFFLSKKNQGDLLVHPLARRASVKDIIESYGVPHTEVGQLFFNDHLIDFQYIPVSKGCLHVQARPVPFSVLHSSILRPEPLTRIKFIADVNVIRLGKLLLLSGFDVSYSSGYGDHEIADIAETQKRIVLTRDTGLLKHKKIVFAKRIKANMPYDQLFEVIEFFGIRDMILFFSRCTHCNAKLEAVEKKDILDRLEPKTKQYIDRFSQCPECGRIFWKGSHCGNIRTRLSRLFKKSKGI